MIDAKKIEEAQEEIFEDKFHFNGEYVMMSEGDSEPHRVEMYDDGQIKEAFKAGANWAINEFLKDLWHDASEEPKKDANCLVYISCEYEDTPEDNYREYTTSMYLGGCWSEDHFPSEADAFIIKWCYLDDLLKGGEK